MQLRDDVPEKAKDTKFKKGQSGNPKGRPPGTTLHQRVKAAMETKIKNTPYPISVKQYMTGITGSDEKHVLDALIGTLIVQGMSKKNSINAIGMLFDRAFGKPKQDLDITTGGERINEVKIKIIDEAEDDTDS